MLHEAVEQTILQTENPNSDAHDRATNVENRASKYPKRVTGTDKIVSSGSTLFTQLQFTDRTNKKSYLQIFFTNKNVSSARVIK